MDPEAKSIFDIEIAPRFHTLPLPLRFKVDGLAGGDVVLKELTTGAFVDMIENPGDRALASVHSFRGGKLPEGADREEWWRALPGGLARLLRDSGDRFNALPDGANKVEVVERDGVVFHRLTLTPETLGAEAPAFVEMRELTWGKIDDVISASVAAKQKTTTFALAAAALGRDCAGWLRALPARVGTAILHLYAQIHKASAEEEADFFGAATASREAPKAI